MLKLRVILERPPAGVDFALQEGKGNDYQPVQLQRSTGKDLVFTFETRVEGGRLLGPFVQGPPAARFVYLDIGTCAGQKDTPWSRRLKIPLPEGARDGESLVTRVPGTGKDGGPSCATVKPFAGWKRA